MADLDVKRTAADLNPLQRELEGLFKRELYGTAAAGADSRGIPLPNAELAGTGGRSNVAQVAAKPQGAAGAGNTVGVGQNQKAQRAAKVTARREAPKQVAPRWSFRTPRFTLGEIAMLTLQEQLDDLIKRRGDQGPLVQMLRNQITAEKSGKSFYELYTSMAAKADPPKASQPDISVLPFKDDWPGGVLVQGELLKSFERVLRGLKTRRKTNIFYGNVDELFNAIDEGYLNDVGDPIGNGMPIHYLHTHISDQGMTDMLGLEEDELLTVTPSAKVKFARERITALQSDYDADICPGYWLLPVTSNSEDRFFLGYSVTGYSFSGIEWRQEGAFFSEADFIKTVCCESKMLFENCLCVKGVPTRVEKIDDATLLRLIWGS